MNPADQMSNLLLWERMLSLIGLVIIIVIAWGIGGFQRPASWRIVIGGVLLQFLIAGALLNEAVRVPFFAASQKFAQVIGDCSNAGADFVFGINGQSPSDAETAPGTLSRNSLLSTFAFGVLPTVIFFSALMSVLYYLRIMQLLVNAVSWLMKVTLGTTGAETLAASANIFVGHTEAPLVIKPYLAKMTRSELNALMIGGFASVTGSLLLAYKEFGADVGHLLTACFISAPASLVVAKLIVPMKPGEIGSAEATLEESKVSQGSETPVVSESKTSNEAGPRNLIDAAASGAADGLKMALNIGAMLIAFLALIAFADWMLGSACWLIARLVEYAGGSPDAIPILTLRQILGYAFAPLAWLVGIESKDVLSAGELLGIKVIANEFVAYEQMGRLVNTAAISPRTQMLMTYALCGFSNLSAIGIQVGGISALVPERRGEIASLGLRAMFGGFLACNMTACVVGILVSGN